MHQVLRGGFALTMLAAVPANAERVTNPIAVFNGLDKITGITTRFEVKVHEQAKFGGLIVKPEVCYTRPITEAPKTTSFVQIEEDSEASSKKRFFSGWMFAESPGLNALEHPIIDIWLIGCIDPNAPPPPVESALKKPEEGAEQSSSESGDVGEEADASATPNSGEPSGTSNPNTTSPSQQPADGNAAGNTAPADEQQPTGLAVPEPPPEQDTEAPPAQD